MAVVVDCGETVFDLSVLSALVHYYSGCALALHAIVSPDDFISENLWSILHDNEDGGHTNEIIVYVDCIHHDSSS